MDQSSKSVISKLRSFRVGGFAVIDFVGTLLGMYLIAPYVGISRRSGLLLGIPLGILAHELVGLRTPLNKLVFESDDCTARVIVWGLTLAGALSLCKDWHTSKKSQ